MGWIDREEERKTITKGESWCGDELLAESEAIFVVIDTVRYDAPTTPDASTAPEAS